MIFFAQNFGFISKYKKFLPYFFFTRQFIKTLEIRKEKNIKIILDTLKFMRNWKFFSSFESYTNASKWIKRKRFGILLRGHWTQSIVHNKMLIVFKLGSHSVERKKMVVGEQSINRYHHLFFYFLNTHPTWKWWPPLQFEMNFLIS